MTVYACCRTDVVSVKPEATVLDVARLMKETNVGSVVVTVDEKPIGIITDRDLAMRVLARKMNPEKTRVKEVMSKDPILLEINMGLFEAMEFMKTKGVRRMPVIDRDGKLQGIITVDDIIRLLVEEMSCIAKIIEKESIMATL